jgi:hypothetical protein
VLVVPVVLGKGRSQLEGFQGRLKLKLTGAKAFGSVNLLLDYEPE